VESVAVGEAFDGGDPASVVLRRERQASEDAYAVGQHCAGAAAVLVAALLGAGQREAFAEEVQQRDARVGREFGRDSIDEDGHGRLLLRTFPDNLSDKTISKWRIGCPPTPARQRPRAVRAVPDSCGYR
jgi:hypothetical protein